MAGVDGLLKLASQSGADELRLGTDEAPRMYAQGVQQRLSMPPTSEEMLRLLLGPLLDEEAERELRERGLIERSYTADNGQSYGARLQLRGGPSKSGPLALDVQLRKAAPKSVAPAVPVAAPVAPVAAHIAPAGAPVAPAGAPVAPVGAPVTPVGAPYPHAAPVEVHPIAHVPMRAPMQPIAPQSQLAALLARAAALGASDVHLGASEPPRLRIDGTLRTLSDLGELPLEPLLAEVLGDAGRAALAAGRSYDGSFALEETGRFRLHVYRAQGQLAAAIRVLPDRAPLLGELNLPLPLEELVAAPHGLVLVCGPTGSGKSATLAALAEEALRRRAGLLVTLEDPIEYALRPISPGALVRQRQVGVDVRDFPSGLRDALREDPDVLLIGEMRDPETISLALTAAETGHLVLASLHSRSAASTVERIVDSYPPERQGQIRVQLADALRAVIAQRLLPRARGAGRLPALEVMRGTHTVANLIREGKTAQLATVLQSGRKEGMLPLERCLADLVRSGQLQREQALAAANDLTSLQSYLTG